MLKREKTDKKNLNSAINKRAFYSKPKQYTLDQMTGCIQMKQT